MSDIFACHACGLAWSTGPAGTKAHRAECAQYDNFCAKLLDGPLRINTPAGPIKVTADPTLRPGEFRMEQPAPCCFTATGGYACRCHAPTGEALEFKAKPAGWEREHVEFQRDYLGEWREPSGDPLDVEYDGRTLCWLLNRDEAMRREDVWTRQLPTPGRGFTPAQHAAVSAHWSAQLRAKVAAGAAADKARETSVVVDLEDW